MPTGPEIHNMRLISHNDLQGYGNVGEGMAIQQLPNGRRILWLAHETVIDFTGVDVTDVQNPRVIFQSELPHREMRSNSLALVDDILYVAHQSSRPNLKPAGVDVYDVSEPESPRIIGNWDGSGPNSRGCHCLWGVDGKYLHLASGTPDINPRNAKDDQMYVVLDVADPTKPFEAGRWWIPGTLEGDDDPPPERHPDFDSGFSMHNTNVYPERPDRAYCANKDGGVVILDISDVGNPKQVARLDYHPPLPGFTHTVVPLFNRELLVVTEESVRDGGADWPKLTWVMDMRVESNPIMLASLPMPDVNDFFSRPGRFGAHNVHENQPVATSFISEELVFGTYFNGGLRVHEISNPFEPKEIAYYIPEEPVGEHPSWQEKPLAGVNINDVYVDENRLVYAVDRQTGGLHILELTV